MTKPTAQKLERASVDFISPDINPQIKIKNEIKQYELPNDDKS